MLVASVVPNVGILVNQAPNLMLRKRELMDEVRLIGTDIPDREQFRGPVPAGMDKSDSAELWIVTEQTLPRKLSVQI